MSYQVLARKWRPAKFSELVGQEHVKSAIINGLTHQRTHHAYLFTGTRGVGKTTIARIFAKSLNCETGVSAEPCGTCSVCVDVDAGRFVDLIEIDAASRTKVGDTREILDNVQYAPTRGRYKIYLIDEVHMLSRHSFNALLKTLEEPPEHVKFLFATTDPQKLPVTILSRCLQFNLQALSVVQIATQLQSILNAEQIPFEPSALDLLAKFARGSMRDGLSLTDQAIAQSGQNITLDVVQQMLGTVDQTWSLQILQAVISQDSEQLVELFSRLQQQQPDFIKIFDDLITLTHQVAMCQLVPAAAQLSEENEAMIKKFATHVSAQQVQVFYQMLIQGKKELPYSVSPASGLEMTCLRLLAFSPAAPEVIELKDTNVAEKKNAEPLLSPVVADNKTEAVDEAKSKAEQETKIEQDTKVEPDLKPDASSTITTTLASTATPTETATPATTDAAITEELAPVSEPSSSAKLDTTEDVLIAASSEAPPLDAYADYQEMSDDSEHFDTSVNSTSMEQESGRSFNDHENERQPDSMTESAIRQTATDPIAGLSDADNPVLAILASRGVNLSGKPSLNEATLTTNEPVQQNKTVEIVPSETKPLEPSSKESAASESTPLNANSVELKPVESEEVRYAHEVDKWAAMIEQSGLLGLGRQLALNSEVIVDGDKIELIVREEFAHLLNERSEQDLRNVVATMIPASEFIINKSAVTTTAPSDIQQNINLNRQQRAEQSIEQDPTIVTLLNEFDAKIIEDSIKPL